MFSEDLRACLKPVVIVQKVIWFALTAPIPIYLSVLFGWDGGSELPLPALPGWLGAVFTAAAIIAGGFSILYRRRAFSDERLQTRLRESPGLPLPPTDAAAPPADTPSALADKVRAYMALGPADRRLLGLATWLIVPQVICLAANEAVVSFGFVLGLLGGSPAAAIPFAAAALVLNFLVYPRTEEILLRLQVWADVS